jgi:hypothetical protein
MAMVVSEVLCEKQCIFVCNHVTQLICSQTLKSAEQFGFVFTSNLCRRPSFVGRPAGNTT